MAITCISCKKAFKSHQGLTRHQNTCEKVLSDFKRLYLRKKAQYKHAKLAKAARKGGVEFEGQCESGPGLLNDPEVCLSQLACM
jgi:hypothetical protein